MSDNAINEIQEKIAEQTNKQDKKSEDILQAYAKKVEKTRQIQQQLIDNKFELWQMTPEVVREITKQYQHTSLPFKFVLKNNESGKSYIVDIDSDGRIDYNKIEEIRIVG